MNKDRVIFTVKAIGGHYWSCLLFIGLSDWAISISDFFSLNVQCWLGKQEYWLKFFTDIPILISKITVIGWIYQEPYFWRSLNESSYSFNSYFPRISVDNVVFHQKKKNSRILEPSYWYRNRLLISRTKMESLNTCKLVANNEKNWREQNSNKGKK